MYACIYVCICMCMSSLLERSNLNTELFYSVPMLIQNKRQPYNRKLDICKQFDLPLWLQSQKVIPFSLYLFVQLVKVEVNRMLVIKCHFRCCFHQFQFSFKVFHFWRPYSYLINEFFLLNLKSISLKSYLLQHQA